MSKLKLNFTQIPNYFLDEINSDGRFSSADFKILLTIARKTYGWHKDRDRISLSQMEKLTGLSKNTVRKSIDNLKKHNLIIHESGDNSGKISEYEINDAMSNFDTGSKKAMSKSDTGPMSKIDTTKYSNINKANEINTPALPGLDEPIFKQSPVKINGHKIPETLVECLKVWQEKTGIEIKPDKSLIKVFYGIEKREGPDRLKQATIGTLIKNSKNHDKRYHLTFKGLINNPIKIGEGVAIYKSEFKPSLSGKTWQEILKADHDPMIFIENKETLKKNISKEDFKSLEDCRYNKQITMGIMGKYK